MDAWTGELREGQPPGYVLFGVRSAARQRPSLPLPQETMGDTPVPKATPHVPRGPDLRKASMRLPSHR
eukprot:scaffold13655_cov114-Isochrysis_galbana.AAC.6